jgi:hypothetical protein
MKTTIEYKDGTVEKREGLAPTFDVEDETFDLMDDQCGVQSAIIPFEDVVRVVFEP